MMSETKTESIAELMDGLGKAARRAAGELAECALDVRNRALSAAAAAIRRRSGDILQANDKDMAAARERGISAARCALVPFQLFLAGAVANPLWNPCTNDDP